MQFSRRSIITKLLLLFLFVGLSTLMIVGTYSFYSAKRAIMRRTVDQLISVRAVKKQHVEQFFTEKIKNLKNLCHNENLGGIFPADSNDLKTKPGLEQEFDHLRNYYLAYDFTNLFLVSGDPSQPRVITTGSDHPYELTPNMLSHIKSILETSRRRDVVVSDFFYSSDSDSLPVCLIGCSAGSGKRESQGTVILEIPATEINRIMLQNNSKIGLGQSGETYLVGSDFLSVYQRLSPPHCCFRSCRLRLCLYICHADHHQLHNSGESL